MSMLADIKKGLDCNTASIDNLEKKIEHLSTDMKDEKKEITTHDPRLAQLETVTVPDLERLQYENANLIAFLLLKEKESYLRLRGVPFLEEEKLRISDRIFCGILGPEKRGSGSLGRESVQIWA